MKITHLSSMPAGLRRCFVNLCAYAVLILCVPSAGAVTNITFTLEGNYTTSAAVYKPDGTLVATLWLRSLIRRERTRRPGMTTMMPA